MARKKKILPDELLIIIDEVRSKQEQEEVQEARELVNLIKLNRPSDHWDVGKDLIIEYFDPTLSYEITGYRPITETQGLDFDPSWFTQARDEYKRTGHYCPYLKGSKRYNEFWREEYIRCKYGYTVNGYTLTGDNYFFLNYYLLPTVNQGLASGAGTSDDFPIFFSSLYMFFHYLQMARVLHRHCALMKARSIGRDADVKFRKIGEGLTANTESILSSLILVTRRH